MDAPFDREQAFRPLSLASKRGAARAQLNLAEMYRRGLATAVDLGEAFRLYESAAGKKPIGIRGSPATAGPPIPSSYRLTRRSFLHGERCTCAEPACGLAPERIRAYCAGKEPDCESSAMGAAMRGHGRRGARVDVRREGGRWRG